MLRFLKQIEKFASILMLGIMCFCITLQVFFRYVLSNALEWPEEVSRYAFLCAVFLGASFAAAEGRHLEISVLKNLFGRTVKLAVTLISAAATVVFCGIMCVLGGPARGVHPGIGADGILHPPRHVSALCRRSRVDGAHGRQYGTVHAGIRPEDTPGNGVCRGYLQGNVLFLVMPPVHR